MDFLNFLTSFPSLGWAGKTQTHKRAVRRQRIAAAYRAHCQAVCICKMWQRIKLLRLRLTVFTADVNNVSQTE